MITHNPYLQRLAALSDDELLQQARGSIYNALRYRSTTATRDAIYHVCQERGLAKRFLEIEKELEDEKRTQQNEQYQRIMQHRKEGYRSE